MDDNIEEKEKVFHGQMKALIGNFFSHLGQIILEAPDTHEIRTHLLNTTLSTAQNLSNTSRFPNETGSANQGIQSMRSRPILSDQRSDNEEEENKVRSETMLYKHQIEVDLSYVFEETFTSMDEVLEKLNEEASKYGFKFNRGPFDRSRGYYAAYCKYKPRNMPKQDKGNSLDEEEDQSNNPKKEYCSAFYRFREINNELVLISQDSKHSHEGIDTNDITEAMKIDLRFMKKNLSVVDIIDFLEAKFKCTNLNYQKVYYQFRKVKPLLGLKDCAHFTSYLREKKFYVDPVFQEDDETLCKIFFASSIMQTNYSLFGDILILDTTYNTNKYKIPLLIFTGIAPDGRNIVFGMACLNDETTETYTWALKSFLSLHKTSPKIIVTDGDLALCKAINNENINSKHFLCQWHIVRNFSRNFAFLKKANEKLFYNLLRLPYVSDKKKAESDFNSLKDFFKPKEDPNISQEDSQIQKKKKDLNVKYTNYLNDVWEYKEKWANAYKPIIFSAGAHTTSRAESMNSLVKKYVNRQSELSAMIELLVDLDEGSAFKVKKTSIKDQKEPILNSIKDKISEIIYQKHCYEFSVSSHYLVVRIPEEENTYKVVFDDFFGGDDSEVEEEKEGRMRTITKVDSLFSCSCNFFMTNGIICRHLFCIAKVLQIKDMCPYLHPRWLIGEVEKQNPFTFNEEDLKQIKKDEKLAQNLEEKEMIRSINFHNIVDGARRIKRKTNKSEKEKKESKERILDDDVFFEEEKDDKNETDSKEEQERGKKKVIKNFEKKTKTKGKPKKHEKDKGIRSSDKKRKEPPVNNPEEQIENTKKQIKLSQTLPIKKSPRLS